MMFRTTIEVPCTVEIEQTPEFLAAHVTAEGVDIRPGDRVLVHGAPARVAFGERVSVRVRATVQRAGWLGRMRAHLTGLLEITEMFEVGFQAREIL
jgi:hypothetical protein